MVDVLTWYQSKSETISQWWEMTKVKELILNDVCFYYCGAGLKEERGLTRWFPKLDIICLNTPGYALQLLHLRWKPQHSVEMTNSHRITQLVWVKRRKKAMTLNGVVLGVHDNYWSNKYVISSAPRCREKQYEASRTKISLCTKHRAY